VPSARRAAGRELLRDLGRIAPQPLTVILAKAMEKTVDGPTQEQVDSIVWFHPFTFPNGVKTRGIKGGGSPEYCEEAVRLEAQAAFKCPVRGKTVLDVGVWNGYFSVEAVRQGASRVVALDKPTWENDHFRGFRGFELVRQYLSP